MKIAVIAANGKSGSLIVKEAVEKGLDVTAIVRGENKTVAKNVITKDLFDLTREDLVQFDVVVNAFGAWTEETLPNHKKGAEHLVQLLDSTETRLLVIGGAGSLYVDEELTIMLSETEGFPKEYLPVANAAAEGLEVYRNSKTNWTYICPAADFVSDGEKTGQYIVAGEVFTVNEKGESKISYADYAIAFVEEIISAKNIKKRISVLGK